MKNVYQLRLYALLATRFKKLSYRSPSRPLARPPKLQSVGVTCDVGCHGPRQVVRETGRASVIYSKAISWRPQSPGLIHCLPLWGRVGSWS